MVHRKYHSLVCSRYASDVSYRWRSLLTQSTLKGQYTSRNESMGSEKKYAPPPSPSPRLRFPQTAQSRPRRVRVPPSITSAFPYRHQSHLTHLLPRRLFYGHWPSTPTRGQTSLLVEQVSHHPPITAYVIENKSKGVRLVGHNAQKTSFSGTLPPSSTPIPSY